MPLTVKLAANTALPIFFGTMCLFTMATSINSIDGKAVELV